jgi:hypothetical protein
MSEFVYENSDTLAAAMKYPESISLVFASHKRPGGGYKNHENGQEEYIARRSNLVDRLSRYGAFYGDNRKPFYISLTNVNVHYEAPIDMFVVPAPVAKLYDNPLLELEVRISTMCDKVKDYDTFIIGAWGCGFFGNELKDVACLFKKYVKNNKVVVAIPSEEKLKLFEEA